MSDEERMLKALEDMLQPSGFDVVIVCCSNLAAENYWQKRLEQTVKQVTGVDGVILAVHEDWNGGAGNGLGTLYAFQKACDKAAASPKALDLKKMVAGGASVALYHTAGKGTRLAPLPGAENNNKPGVKLPSLLSIEGSMQPLTVLEAVMRQTSSYASVRGGRISVFWGDQVFVPSTELKSSSHPADILAALRPMPTKEEWEAGQLHQYGLIAVDPRGDAVQLEKVTYDVAKEYLPPDIEQVGTSLGSFSVTGALMESLQAEFAKELVEKCECYDSDPHFWMPFTLKRENYVAVMGKKGTEASIAGSHYDRMLAFRTKFQPTGGMLGCVDVGQAAYWWDYGRLELYQQNNLHATEDGPSPDALRRFLQLHGAMRQQSNQLGDGVVVDPTSVVLNCRIAAGRVGPNCVLVNVTAPSVDVEGAILMNVTSTSPVAGKAGVLYNVVDESGSPLGADAVRADVFMPGKKLVVKSAMSIDGGKAWKEKLEGNEDSFEGVYKTNQKLDVSECVQLGMAAHAAAAAKIP